VRLQPQAAANLVALVIFENLPVRRSGGFRRNSGSREAAASGCSKSDGFGHF